MGQIIMAAAEEGDKAADPPPHLQQAKWETRHELSLTKHSHTGVTK